LLEEQANLAYREAVNGYSIQGIGKLVLVNRSARQGRNPATGEIIQIPAKTAVRFRVAKMCKDGVLG
jgi:DNA-binding protein HU-beta